MSIKYSKSKIFLWALVSVIALYLIVSQITGNNIIFHTIYYFSNPDKRVVENQNYTLELSYFWIRKNKYLIEHIFFNDSILMTESCTENELEKYRNILYEMCVDSGVELSDGSFNNIVTQEYICKKAKAKYEQNEYKFIYMPSINSCFLVNYLEGYEGSYTEVLSTIEDKN